ncbi:diguanylate cyclase [Thiohalorhabdus sp.]|uniref:diguanylate cyclase n=1 Tax=Thiohalorhabdus sp. TaxID=3094134 RepID=UPI002FC37B3B
MSEAEPQTVLVVDDEASNVQALAKLIKDEARVQVANNGEKALAIATGGQAPDLILLDIEMPGLDGYEVCRCLKADPQSSDTPVIFVTARDSASDEEKGLMLGAVDYIAKPFHPPIVRARVRTHLDLKHKTDQLEHIAWIDGLTNIPNRRYFDEMLHKEYPRAQRECQHLAVIMMDLDNFKAFNDHYGHGAGDHCLQRVAQAVKGVAGRPGDLVARYGGEELAALLPGTDAPGSMEVAERFRKAAADLAIPHAYSSAAGLVTLSLGVAELAPDSGEAGASQLLHQADEALYKAKTDGRNRVAIAE